MPEKLEWGISIEPMDTISKGGELQAITFQFKFGRGNPRSRLFYSDEKLAKAIESRPNIQNLRMGQINYSLNLRAGKVVLSSYFPFDVLLNFSYLKLGTPGFKSLVKTVRSRGIASALERAAIRYLAKKYPDFYYRETSNPLRSRRKQLKKRGIKRGQEMPLREYWKLIQKTTWDWRKKKQRRRRMWSAVKGNVKKYWQKIRRR